MKRSYRDLCREVDIATTLVADATKSVEKALDGVVGTAGPLLAIKPTPIVDGKELPQTIHFADPLSNRLGGTD